MLLCILKGTVAKEADHYLYKTTLLSR